MKRVPLLLAALALSAGSFVARGAAPVERVQAQPQNRPPLREDTYTAKRKAKARAKRGW